MFVLLFFLLLFVVAQKICCFYYYCYFFLCSHRSYVMYIVHICHCSCLLFLILFFKRTKQKINNSRYDQCMLCVVGKIWEMEENVRRNFHSIDFFFCFSVYNVYIERFSLLFLLMLLFVSFPHTHCTLTLAMILWFIRDYFRYLEYEYICRTFA